MSDIRQDLASASETMLSSTATMAERQTAMETVHRLRPIVTRMDRDAGATGRHAHRTQRAMAQKAEAENRHADDAKHPRKGWTVTGAKVSTTPEGEKLYSLTRIAPAPRPAPTPIRSKQRSGVTGGYVEGAKAENAIKTENHSLHRDSGSLISRIEATLKVGNRSGLGDLRLEAREMSLRIRVSNPQAAAYLAALERKLRTAQYEVHTLNI